MQDSTGKSSVPFANPFRIPGFDKFRPGAAIEVEAAASPHADRMIPERGQAPASAIKRPRQLPAGHPLAKAGPLSALGNAPATNRKTRRNVVDFFVGKMLAGPMVRHVMKANRASEAELRGEYARSPLQPAQAELPDQSGKHDARRRSVPPTGKAGAPKRPV